MLTRLFTLISKQLTKQEQGHLIKLQYFVVLLTASEVLFIVSFGDMMAWINTREASKLYAFANMYGIQDDRVLAIGFMLLMVLGSAAALFSALKIALIPNKVGAMISARLYGYYLSQNIDFHESISSATLISKLSQEIARVTNQILHPLTQLNASLTLGTVLILFLLIKYPHMAVLGGGFIVVVYAAIYLYVSKSLTFHGQVISKTHDKSITYMKDGFQGITDYVTTNAVPEIINNFKGNIFQFGRSAGLVKAYNTLPKFALETGIVLVAIMYVFYIKFIVKTEVIIDPAEAGVFGLVVMKLLPVIHKIYSMISVVVANLAALDSINDDLYSSTQARIDECSDLAPPKQHDIVFLNVSFEKEGKKILDDINLRIEKGEKVALVGGSGAGKSTLLKLASGLWRPSRGSVYLGGVDISLLPRESLYETIAYCPQQIHISNGTIKNNILMSEIAEGDEAILSKSIESSSLLDVITELPEGVETRLAENAVSLSGGQRQRIGIARAFYRDKSVIMFDESTSALDSKTEQAVIQSVLSSAASVIFISHRVQSLTKFDRIYFLEDGKVVDFGDYNDLKTRSEKFRQLLVV